MPAPAAPRHYVDHATHEIQDLIYAGQKIQAIKRVREQDGSGLKEAKDKVDALEAEMRAAFPGALPAASRSGCAGILLLTAAALALLLLALR